MTDRIDACHVEKLKSRIAVTTLVRVALHSAGLRKCKCSMAPVWKPACIVMVPANMKTKIDMRTLIHYYWCKTPIACAFAEECCNRSQKEAGISSS